MNINGKNLTAKQILALIKVDPNEAAHRIADRAAQRGKSAWFLRNKNRHIRATGCKPMEEAE